MSNNKVIHYGDRYNKSINEDILKDQVAEPNPDPEVPFTFDSLDLTFDSMERTFDEIL